MTAPRPLHPIGSRPRSARLLGGSIPGGLLLSLLLFVSVGFGVSACAGGEGEAPAAEAGQVAAAPGPSPNPAPAQAKPPAGRPEGSREPRVVFLGDSLTAGYGLAKDDAYPARLAELLEKEGRPVEVVNAGVSGDTTAGGLARVDWILRQHPDVVVVELGGNDGLRGLSLDMTESNLRRIVEKVKASGARVLLVGMKLPPNYGPQYTHRFEEIYPQLAKELGVPLVPFLLEGVGGEPRLNQPDGIHPTAEGHRLVAKVVLPYLEKVLSGLPSVGG